MMSSIFEIKDILNLLSGALLMTNITWAFIFLSGLSLGITQGKKYHQSTLRQWTGWLALWLAFGFVLSLLNQHYFDSDNYFLRTIARYYYAYFNMLTLPLGALVMVQLVTPQPISWKRILYNVIPFIVLCGTGLLIHPAWQHTYFITLAGLMACYVIAMIIYIITRGRHYQEELKDLYSSTYGRSVKWMAAVVTMLIIAAINFTMIVMDEQYVWIKLIRLPLLIMLWNYIFAKVYIMTMIREEPVQERQPIEEEMKKKVETEIPQVVEEKPVAAEEDDLYDPIKNFRRQLREVCEVTELYTKEDLTRDELAEKMKMGRTTFTTMLKQAMGLSFYDYINGLRIEKATALLANKFADVGTVGKTVGYSYRSTFNRAFAAVHGCTPTEYRESKEVVK